MKSNSISILFVVAKLKINKKGLCPIRCRITYFGERKTFSTGLFVAPSNWDSKSQIATLSGGNNFVNDSLEIIRYKIQESYLKLKVQNKEISVDDILNDYKGLTLQKEKGTIEIFDLHNSRIKKLVGLEIKEVTYSKYVESRNHLSDFIVSYFKKKDIEINKLKSVFLDNYEYFLKTEKKLQQSTINKAIQRFRKVIKYAIAEEYLNKDPFMLYKPVVKKKEVIFLTQKELLQIEEYQFSQSRLQRIKDMFIFCCYCGLPFKEMASLKPEHITNGFDNRKWINIIRSKTNRPLSIPLLPKAEEILNLYEGSEFCFPRIQNQNFNSYLKEIGAVIGIQKNITHHMARRTFATTVLLYNDVPMEIVSELLGHSKMATTQLSYGKIVKSKVSEAMYGLGKKMKTKN
jgi:integrase/recombinase XerD